MKQNPKRALEIAIVPLDAAITFFEQTLTKIPEHHQVGGGV